MWVAIFYDTDGCTYGTDIILGVYQTRPEADESILRWVEKHRPNELNNASVEERDFGDWDF
jgi:hypothetical protein